MRLLETFQWRAPTAAFYCLIYTHIYTMLSIINTEKENLIAARLSGTLNKADLEKVHPLIHQVINNGHKVDWYLEIEEGTTYSLAGLLEDFKIDLLHFQDYGKIAVVGEKKWQEWGAKAANYLTNSDVKFYDPADQPQALQWATA